MKYRPIDALHAKLLRWGAVRIRRESTVQARDMRKKWHPCELAAWYEGRAAVAKLFAEWVKLYSTKHKRAK